MRSILLYCVITSLFVLVQGDFQSIKGLIMDYFTNVRKVHNLNVISCFIDLDSAKDMQKEANARSLRTQIIDMNNIAKVQNVLEIKVAPSIMGVYLDCTCNGCDSLLKQVVFCTFLTT